MPEFKTCSEAVWADDRHKKLTEDIAKQWREADKKEKEIRPLLYELQALLRAMDLCADQIFKEVDSEEQDSAIELITGENAEVWSCNWARSADAVRDAAVALCSRVSHAGFTRQTHKDKQKNLEAERDTLAAEIRAAWHKEKEAV